jgi:hypothetical protein
MVNTNNSLQNGSHSGSGDMYRDILKEIGAEEANMDYLFDETSDDEEDDDDDDSLLHNHEEKHVPTPPKVALQTLSMSESSDEELLHQWESDHEEEIFDGSFTRPVSHQKPTFKSPEWKSMLKEASLQQEELQAQLANLQMTQRKSSLSNHRLDDALVQQSHKSLTETTPGNKDDQSSDISTPVLQEISIRNAKLQEEWQSQQKQTLELQQKLNNLQTQFHNDQDQWNIEKNELFSPVRSSTRIPRWGSTPTKSSSKVSFMETPSSSRPKGSSTTESNNGSKSRNDERATNSSITEFSLLQQRDKRIRELEAQLEESKHIQAQQAEELKDAKDRLKTREVEYSSLLLQYETQKKDWHVKKEEMEVLRRHEKESCAKELEVANDLLQKQIELNQEQREELQQLKSSSWKDELEETQKRIKLAVAQQAEKSGEFQARIQELEDRHKEERQSWQSQLEDYKTQLEENSMGWEQQLEEASTRYQALEDKYLKETKEWQHLLEMDMSAAVEPDGEKNGIFRPNGGSEEGKSIKMLSPIQRDKSMHQGNNDTSSKDSSLQIETVPSQSMERIDNLLYELGQLNAEREAILDEINAKTDDGQVNDHSYASIEFANRDDSGSVFNDETPKPVESLESSPRNRNELNTTTDSAVLDRTLSLLQGLKDLMTNGDGAQNETTVLENLEVLSELMQDQCGFQSMLLSPRQSVGDAQSSPQETSLDNLHDNLNNTSLSGAEHDTTWILSVKAAMNPWPALVAELKSRCEFLESDRNELARITEKIIKMERDSHQVEMEAAIGTEKREAAEKIHEHELKYNRQVRMMYHSLCYHCQKKVYSML